MQQERVEKAFFLPNRFVNKEKTRCFPKYTHAGKRNPMEEHPEKQARTYALKLLSQRNHTRFELQEKLRRKGFGDDTASSVLNWLDGRMLVDDKAFGKELIDTLSKRKPSGQKALRFALLRRGIPEQTASELLKTCDSLDCCYRAGMKKLASMKSVDEAEKKRKLEVFLRNRGFEWPDIQATTERLLLPGRHDETDRMP